MLPTVSVPSLLTSLSSTNLKPCPFASSLLPLVHAVVKFHRLRMLQSWCHLLASSPAEPSLLFQFKSTSQKCATAIYYRHLFQPHQGHVTMYNTMSGWGKTTDTHLPGFWWARNMYVQAAASCSFYVTDEYQYCCQCNMIGLIPAQAARVEASLGWCAVIDTWWDEHHLSSCCISVNSSYSTSTVNTVTIWRGNSSSCYWCCCCNN